MAGAHCKKGPAGSAGRLVRNHGGRSGPASVPGHFAGAGGPPHALGGLSALCRNLQLSVGLAPCFDTVFNRGRSLQQGI